MNEKQRKFVREYLKDFNATQAAIRAGYSEKAASVTAYRMLRNAKVKEAVEMGTTKQENRAKVTKDDVIEMMLNIYRTCSAKMPQTDREGNQIYDDQGSPLYKMVDSPAAAKAADMLAKHVGAYEADKQISGEIKILWGDKCKK